eukprot:g2970.t1
MKDPENAKLLWGFLFEVRRFVDKLSPVDHSEGLRQIRTNNFTMFVLESASGLVFVLNTDNSVSKDMVPDLKYIYRNLFVEIVVKNPLQSPHSKITNKTFDRKIQEYFKSVRT